MLYFTDEDDTGIKLLTQNTTPADIGALSSTIDELYYDTTGLPANTQATLKYNISNYKLIIVYASIYTNAVSTNARFKQIGEQTIPYALINKLERAVDTFLIAGSLSGTTRRLYFGFPNNTTIKTGTVDGTSGNLPRLFAVYGIK